MWQNLLVILILLVAAGLLGRRLIRQFKGQASCGCSGCPGCPGQPAKPLAPSPEEKERPPGR